MSFYPVVPSAVTFSAGEDAAAGLLGLGGMVAVRLADLASPAGAGLGKDGRSALVAEGAGKIRKGDVVVVFLKPVAVAAAVVRRDGRVQAAGHPCDHVRLGAAEERLDVLCGRPGVIEQAAADLRLNGKVKGERLRVMTPALAIRLVLLMTLMPGSAYPEVMVALSGNLAGVPWHRPWAPPTPAAACAWRAAIGAEPLEWLRDLLLAGIGAEHQDHDYRAVTVGDLDVCSADGCLTRVPDTPVNRDAFGSAGTADDSSPYPQVREVRFSNASTRATLAVTCGPSGAAAGGSREKGEAEQILLDKAMEKYPQVFTNGRIWVMDRNFPGVPRIARMLGTGTHVLIRLKSDIPLRRAGGFLPDGTCLAEMSGGVTLTVRVIEYTITIGGRDAPEMFCLVTDLLDHAAYPAGELAAACHWRWTGSETALKEAKSAISGSGPSAGAMLRSGNPALIAQEHAAWIISAELARAVARAAAATAVPARSGPRAGQPVHPREISFTAARRAIIATTRDGAATASLPAALTSANRHQALTGLARCRVQADRNRHRDRKTKARPGFPPGGPRLPTRTAPARIALCGPAPAQAPPARLARRDPTKTQAVPARTTACDPIPA
jgi:hypothetical protein